ncbi:hypothetical protein G6F46_010477 [Rhizopus delemar]|uniref:Homeobox domain-containing protein n=2 Tax=Rhizopus TaxID=4842 RepID=A0A9P6YVG5_9FUNG|nr:hypothetical protein G6F55_009710 [Rhizopus delemar]KAG1537076.1 hypothetical protein G6F51_010593 [Rhizopus arrhizus]KAG1491325.1 hypothetical protein G6F54_010100 [Rhizopus delemar]KAG1510519.1 hypothetical protein G6F53_006625 [Rhizopus delemar]KAG1520560.1 hypothetical protein G6F52_007548 [Rhizopus delemar]
MTSLLNDNSDQSWSNETNNNNSSQPVRKRTRATADQLSVLEDTFAMNVSPNSKLRKQLAEQLQMSERSIQIWFQNRRAKVKHMQKRAQIQMHQASIRAQLYQYQQQQQQGQYFNQRLNNMTRAQSVDAVQHYRQAAFMPPQMNATPPPVMFLNHLEIARQNSMPPFGLEFSEYPSIQTLKNSSIPTLIPVPDAGPTAVLSDPKRAVSEEVWISSPGTHIRLDIKSIGYSYLTLDSTSHQNTSDNNETTINPSNLVMSNTKEEEEPKDLYLSATTLTVGTWHRLLMGETDLVCVYRPDTRTFAWHIIDGGCHFKMEVTQDAVSRIEYIAADTLAEVHFELSEPPLFYMESTQKEEKVWVQCSDFTEGKQASRFFRHTLKGIQHHLKQELLALIQNHQETKRLVHFVEQPSVMYPIVEYPDLLANNNAMYWPNHGGNMIANDDSSLLSCGLYIS